MVREKVREGGGGRVESDGERVKREESRKVKAREKSRESKPAKIYMQMLHVPRQIEYGGNSNKKCC